MNEDNSTPRTLFATWIVQAVSIYTFGLSIGLPASLSVMFLDWQDSFDVTRAHTAAVHSTCFSIVFGGAVFAGYMTNRIGTRWTILIGSLLAAAGMFASAFATSINFLIVSVGVVSGIGFCCVQLPVIPCVTSVTKKYTTVVIALCLISTAIVGISNRYLLRFLVEQYSWRGACIIISGMTLQTFVGGVVITGQVKSSKNPLLANEEKDRNAIDDPNIEFKTISRHVSLMIINGSTNSLKPSMNGDALHYDEFYQIKDSTSVCTKLSIPNGLSRPGSQIIMIENNTIITDTDSDDEDSDSEGRINNNGGNNKCLSSRWRFFCDIMFILLAFHTGVTVACLSSFSMFLMDFARTLGFDDSTGVSFLTALFATSIIGRIAVGVSGDLGRIHSFVIQIVIAVPGCVALLLLSFITEFSLVIFLLSLIGVSIGGLVTIYPKCALDVKSVDVRSYPIAFGFFCTMEGVMTWILSIAIGLAVDYTGSYTFILTSLGCISLILTAMLACGYLYTQRQQKQEAKRQIAAD